MIQICIELQTLKNDEHKKKMKYFEKWKNVNKKMHSNVFKNKKKHENSKHNKKQAIKMIRKTK